MKLAWKDISTGVIRRENMLYQIEIDYETLLIWATFYCSILHHDHNYIQRISPYTLRFKWMFKKVIQHYFEEKNNNIIKGNKMYTYRATNC